MRTPSWLIKSKSESMEAKCKAVEWLVMNPTQYKLVDIKSPADVNCTVDLFDLAT